jgi:catechol 2,3-dioxygenase-like lactoylglutathione lyase family enzyme
MKRPSQASETSNDPFAPDLDTMPELTPAELERSRRYYAREGAKAEMSSGATRGPRLRAIGEVAIRVRDLEKVCSFYQDVLGLTLLRRFENAVAALKIADGVEGQVQTLTLFDRALPSNFTGHPLAGHDPSSTTLHHFAITIAASDYDATIEHFKERGIPFTTANHRWCGWRGIYLQDPEGNVIELVSYHEDLDEGKTGSYDFGKLHGGTSGTPLE